MRLSLSLSLLSLLACNNDPIKDTDTGPNTHLIDTYVLPGDSDSEVTPGDSDSEIQPGDSDSDPDSDTDTQESTPPPPTLSDVDLYPSRMVVHVGASWQLRAVGTMTDGVRLDVGAPVYTVDDSTILSVTPDGVVTALAAGSTVLHAETEGLTADSLVEVRSDGLVKVSLVDAQSTVPLENAYVKLGADTVVATDSSGVAYVPVADGGPITITAYKDDTYDAVTIVGTVSREFLIPINQKDAGDRNATVHGNIDFSSVADGAWNEGVIGMAVASIHGSLAAMRLEDLFSGERTIEVVGVEAAIPTNFFVEGSADDYYASCTEGPVGAWALSGPLAYSTIGAGLTGGQAITMITDNLSAMTWDWAGGGEAVDGTQTEIDLAPALPFSSILPVTFPALPAGFSGGETLLAIVAEEAADEGWIITGLGAGSGSTTIQHVPFGSVATSVGTNVMVYGQVNGLGTSGGVVTASGTVDSTGTISLPEFQDLPEVVDWTASSRTVTLTADAGADFVRLRIEDPRHRIQDVYISGSWTGDVPAAISGFGNAQAELTVSAYQSTWGTFEEWVSGGALDPRELLPYTAAHDVQ